MRFSERVSRSNQSNLRPRNTLGIKPRMRFRLLQISSGLIIQLNRSESVFKGITCVGPRCVAHGIGFVLVSNFFFCWSNRAGIFMFLKVSIGATWECVCVFFLCFRSAKWFNGGGAWSELTPAIALHRRRRRRRRLFHRIPQLPVLCIDLVKKKLYYPPTSPQTNIT